MDLKNEKGTCDCPDDVEEEVEATLCVKPEDVNILS